MYRRITYFLEKQLCKLQITNDPFSSIKDLILFHISTNDHLLNFLEVVYTKYPHIKIHIASHLRPDELLKKLPLIEHFRLEYGTTVISHETLVEKRMSADNAVLLYSFRATIKKEVYNQIKRAFLLSKSSYKIIIDGDGSIFNGAFLTRLERKVIRFILSYLVPLRDTKEKFLLNKRMIPDPICDFHNAPLEKLCNHTNRILLLDIPFRIEQCLEDGTVLKKNLLEKEFDSKLYGKSYLGSEFCDERPDWEECAKIYKQRRLRNMQKVGFQSADQFGDNPTALDIGCGTGLLSDMLNKLGFDTLGVDISKYSIEIAKKHFLNVKFDVLNVENLLKLQKKFDLITLSHVLEHIKDDKTFLEMIKQLMKPASLLYIEVPWFDVEPLKSRPFWYRQTDHYREYTKLGLYRLLTGCGFHILAHNDSFSDEGNEPYQFLCAKLK